jgi:amidohydrolase
VELKEKIKLLASEFLHEVIEIRRHLHQYPELSFEEYETSIFISEQLKKLGIKHQTGIVKTGIVAIIEGQNPSSKTIALRADMDALPIIEKNNVSYCSKNHGIMHACGHDVHASSLLGVAKILNEIKSEFSGTVKLIFQPGEEKLPGGASLMIKERVLEQPAPEKIFAQHVFPSLEAGKVGFKSGMYMASTDEIYLTVKGKGGHAAMKGTYNNPILIASKVLLELENHFNSITPKDHEGNLIPTVLAFGKIIGKGATNVIPDVVEIEGTFRTMNEKWREDAHFQIKTIAEKVAFEEGGLCEVNIMKGYPFLVNDLVLTEKARKAAEDFLGKENVVELEMRMTAEDFAFFSQQIPSCFYRLGTANESKGLTSGVHTATFDIDEKAMETGMGLMVWLVLNELAGER